MKFSVILKILAAILVPIISGLWVFFSSYLRLEASYYSHLNNELKKDASIERQLGSIDGKLDTLLKAVINDHSNSEKQQKIHQ